MLDVLFGGKIFEWFFFDVKSAAAKMIDQFTFRRNNVQLKKKQHIYIMCYQDFFVIISDTVPLP